MKWCGCFSFNEKAEHLPFPFKQNSCVQCLPLLIAKKVAWLKTTGQTDWRKLLNHGLDSTIA
jgi:hypothetical protein